MSPDPKLGIGLEQKCDENDYLEIAFFQILDLAVSARFKVFQSTYEVNQSSLKVFRHVLKLVFS